MQVDDLNLNRPPDADPALPESGAFVNFRRRRTLSERVYRLLERAGIVIPVTREKPPQRNPSAR
jgi:hypothetical protein